MIRQCQLSGQIAREAYQRVCANSRAAEELLAQRLTATHRRGPVPVNLVKRPGKGCFPQDVYFDPKKVLALTDESYWANLPAESLATDYLYTIAFPSQSDRALAIIWDDGSVSEFKGETLTKEELAMAYLHEQSLEPGGFLVADKGQREAEMLNFLGAISARFHLIGEGQNCQGEPTQYGQLVREASNYLPWLRLDRSLADLASLANWGNKSLEELLSTAAKRSAQQLKKLHAANLFNIGFSSSRYFNFEGVCSYNHIGNIEAHGNIVDLGSVRQPEETQQILQEHLPEIKTKEERFFYAAFIDLYRIFGGTYGRNTQDGLLTGHWDRQAAFFFQVHFAQEYFDHNEDLVHAFVTNWHNPKEMAKILAKQRSLK